MVASASIRVVFILVFVTSNAWCQHSDTQRISSDTPGAPSTLPDAPSPQTTDKAITLRAFENVVSTPATEFARAGGLGTAPTLAHFSERPVSKEPAIFGKYLSRAAVQQSRSYHPSTGDGFISRAAYAASSIVISRDETGRKRLNTSYLLAVLTSAAAHSANCPYCKRSVSQPFSDFGSTMGNDAGINLFHEFEPGIKDLVKSHEPRFIFKIQDRFRH